MTECSARGAYGFRLRGLSAVAGLAQVDLHAPVVTLVARPVPGMHGPRTDADLVAGRVEIDLEERTAVVDVPVGTPDDEVLHPWSTRVLAEFATRDGAAVLHAGVVCGSRGAVVVLGARGAGKSTLVAEAAGRGLAVLGDDLAVIRAGAVAAGPRFLDLRADSAEQLRDRPGLRPARSGARWRLPLPPAPTRVPVVAFVSLQWLPVDAARGEDARVGDAQVWLEAVPVAQRLPALLAHASFERPAEQAGPLLRLVAIPLYQLARTRTWASTPAVLATIRELAGD